MILEEYSLERKSELSGFLGDNRREHLGSTSLACGLISQGRPVWAGCLLSVHVNWQNKQKAWLHVRNKPQLISLAKPTAPGDSCCHPYCIFHGVRISVKEQIEICLSPYPSTENRYFSPRGTFMNQGHFHESALVSECRLHFLYLNLLQSKLFRGTEMATLISAAQ